MPVPLPPAGLPVALERRGRHAALPRHLDPPVERRVGVLRESPDVLPGGMHPELASGGVHDRPRQAVMVGVGVRAHEQPGARRLQADLRHRVLELAGAVLARVARVDQHDPVVRAKRPGVAMGDAGPGKRQPQPPDAGQDPLAPADLALLRNRFGPSRSRSRSRSPSPAALNRELPRAVAQPSDVDARVLERLHDLVLKAGYVVGVDLGALRGLGVDAVLLERAHDLVAQAGAAQVDHLALALGDLDVPALERLLHHRHDPGEIGGGREVDALLARLWKRLAHRLTDRLAVALQLARHRLGRAPGDRALALAPTLEEVEQPHARIVTPARPIRQAASMAVLAG